MPPRYPLWSGGDFLGTNHSQIYPHMLAKFGSGSTVVSKKMGGGGVQTDTHTKGHCSFT